MKMPIVCLFVILAVSCTASAVQPKKPNILFIIADDKYQ